LPTCSHAAAPAFRGAYGGSQVVLPAASALGLAAIALWAMTYAGQAVWPLLAAAWHRHVMPFG
jgi:hypothetical protein